jgi:hypothetical protein
MEFEYPLPLAFLPVTVNQTHLSLLVPGDQLFVREL